MEEGFQVVYESHGQASSQEVGEYLLVADIAECRLVQFVAVHKFVEDISAEHYRLGYHDVYSVDGVQVGVPLEQLSDEGQAASLSAQAAFADACEVAVLVEAFALEDSHHALVLHTSVGDDGVQDDLSVGIHVLQSLPGDVLQELRDGEQGAAGQPAAHVVVCDVVEQAACRHGHDIVLKVLQIVHTYHLLHRIGVSEDKISETEIVEHEVAQVHLHLLAVLVDKVCAAL